MYVVWEPTLGARRRHAAEATKLLSDPRVQHYWKDDFIVGEFFQEHDFGRTAWDIYFLYGPDAEWGEESEPLLLPGRTVIRKRQALPLDFGAAVRWISQLYAHSQRAL